MSVSKRRWSRAILSFDSRIEQAIHVLNNTGLKVVLVTDESGVLVGVISDGDIRRGILKGVQIQSPLTEVLNLNPVTVLPSASREDVDLCMAAKKVFQIPIVDEYKRIIGLHIWNELNSPEKLKNTMIIMAGGAGTRLMPRTKERPKPMLQIAGKPILEHIIIQAKREGFSRFVIAVHHLGDIIKEHFGNGESLGVKISYLFEQVPLGTAGALSLLNPIPEEPIIVTNGDVLTQVRYRDVLDHHLENEAFATMAVQFYEWENPFGVVKVDGIEISEYEEKPLSRFLINAGIYVINPNAISLIERDTPYDMPALFNLIREMRRKVIAYPIHEGWIDIGRPEDLDKALTQPLLFQSGKFSQ